MELMAISDNVACGKSGINCSLFFLRDRYYAPATFRFVFPTLGPRGTPHHTGIFLSNGSKDSFAMNHCTSIFCPAEQIYRV